MTAAFPPLDLGFLAWVGLGPLFYALARALRTRHAFWLGYLFGCVHFGLTITWIGSTVVNWAHTPLGWAAWLILTAIEGLWYGLFGAVAWWVARRSSGVWRMVGLASAWIAVEWLRGQTSVAMPWTLAGYTQYRYLVLIQIADVTGVYGISFALALACAALAEALCRSRAAASPEPPLHPLTPSPPRRILRPLLAPLVLVLLMAAYGLFALHRRYDGPEVRLALMQPNVRSDRSEPDSAASDLARFRAEGSQAAGQHPLLMVWPETIAPTDVVNDFVSRDVFAYMARNGRCYVLVGTTYYDARDREYNSAALFGPDGDLVDRYDKHWLVPMGEWTIGRGWLPFGSVFHFRESDVQPGTTDQPLVAGQVRMSVLICYESVFPVLPRARVAHGANLLVSITNDSWAGESAELQQHHAMTRLRAVETRRYVASSATTGITALIDPYGHTTALPPYREDALVADARLLTGETLYVRFGDWLIVLAVTVLIVQLRPRR